MRDQSEILNEIKSFKENLSKIEKEIEKNKAITEGKKKQFSKKLVSEIGKERKSSSLEVQKRHLTESNLELEAIQGAQDAIQLQLADLEVELERSQLFQIQGHIFSKSMADCEASQSALTDLLASLKDALASFSEHVDNLIAKQRSAIGAFFILYAKVDPGLSLGSFLNGDIVEANESDKEKIAGEIRQRVLALTVVDFESIENEFIDFNLSMSKLEQYRKFISSRDKWTGRHAFVFKQRPKSDSVKKMRVETPMEKESKMRQHPELYSDEVLKQHGIKKRPEKPVFGT